MSSSSNDSQKSLKKSGEVVSKYFNDGKFSMDESISDFQEPKMSCTGPKTTKLTKKPSTTSKNKNKKGSQKIRGQKDIRSILKSNKNELEAYAQDFDKVCKQSGIDVDSEQLQLAIALSKSLQETTNAEQNGFQSSVPLSTQERTGKIRTTLQEYGFKVPEVKIESGKRKLRGRKKSSKLLLITEAERWQNITDKYSQVLIENVNDAKVVNETPEHHKEDVTLYDISSNKSYDYLKSNEIYYVNDLIEISSHSIGTLLRDWSKIPGRPLSPIKKSGGLKFIDLDFAKHEIDIILSGPLIKVQKIVNSKIKSAEQELSKIKDKDSKTPNDEVVFDVPEDSNSRPMDTEIAASIPDMDLLAPTQFPRSASPDLFDDDLSSVFDNTGENSKKFQQSPQNDFTCASQPFSQNLTSNLTRKISNDFMDLTECVSVKSQCSSSKMKNSKIIAPLNEEQTIVSASISQKLNLKNRKFYDLMEITDCVETCEEFKYAVVEDNIDLTQESDHDGAEDTVMVKEVDITVKRMNNIEKLDLTQSSNSNDDTLPFVEISGQKPKDGDVMETIVINNKGSNNEELTGTDKFLLSVDDKLHSPMKERGSKSSKESSVFEEYLFEHSDHSSKENDVQLTESRKHILKTIITDNDIDLTQNSDTSEEIPICDSIYLINEKNCLGKKDDISIDYDEICKTSSKSEEYFQNQSNLMELKSKNTTELSIIDRNLIHEENAVVLNIDHEDEDKIIDKSQQVNNSEQEELVNRISSLSDATSGVFEISDEELNYSMHKSKHLADNSHESNEISYENPKDNFGFGGISIMNNLSTNVDKYKSIYHASVSNITLNKSASDSFLPVVEIKGTKVKIKYPEKVGTSTPIKDVIDKEKFASVETPSNSEYLIKTQDVTPMSDYGAMSTPDRNRELEKYGLKPFKRKRAIQLLTHLYNQTHPVVERFTSEDQSSPSKRPKTDTGLPQLPTSPKKSFPKSPRKSTGKSPKKGHAKTVNDIDEAGPSNSDIDKESNVIYEETQTPSIKYIECLPEDWVFQKREKAKVSLCRVPLHITFHNYVSSRRGVREAMLRYEPVDIDLIHRHLAAHGHRYDPKDLLRFLDKKCITVKTADNNGRNNKRSQRKS